MSSPAILLDLIGCFNVISIHVCSFHIISSLSTLYTSLVYINIKRGSNVLKFVQLLYLIINDVYVVHMISSEKFECDELLRTTANFFNIIINNYCVYLDNICTYNRKMKRFHILYINNF